jgi:hypothetical protein
MDGLVAGLMAVMCVVRRKSKSKEEEQGAESHGNMRPYQALTPESHAKMRPACQRQSLLACLPPHRMDNVVLLSTACKSGNKTEVLRLLEHRVDPNAVEPHLRLAALHRACAKGHLTIVRLLLEYHADVNMFAGGYGWSPLHHAASNAHVDVASELLSRRAQVNAVAPVLKETPLHVAAEAGHESMAMMLIDAGADVNLKRVCTTQ